MTTSSREAMILGYRDEKYRLPTVREAACMMSFPLDFWFYGGSKGIKHTLVGNAVPPKLSYAIAKAIAEKENEPLPKQYPRIEHDKNIEFINLNGVAFEIKKETPRRAVAKFKYHIPYLIIDAYRVELTNYHSDFENKIFKWNAEIHYSQGKGNAKVYIPILKLFDLPKPYQLEITKFINKIQKKIPNMDTFQQVYCMTSEERKKQPWIGPYELLNLIKMFIDNIIMDDQKKSIYIKEKPERLPLKIAVGYYVLSNLTNHMGGLQ